MSEKQDREAGEVQSLTVDVGRGAVKERIEF